MSVLPYWLAALALPGIGPRQLQRLIAQFESIKGFFEAPMEVLRAAGLNSEQTQAVLAPDWDVIERDIRWGEGAGQHIVTWEDQRYPPLLKEIANPPIVLFVRGEVSLLGQPQIAMVGSRHATPGGQQIAKQFASALVQGGYAITSGLALGIDAASHQGALAAQGKTIAVMGTGFQSIYPRVHTRLAETIVSQKGALVSEFPLTMPAHATNFPRRNRIIAGLSAGVVVVEAALKSGSLITARYALEQGRDVFAIPGSIHQPLSRGCHALIREGATLVETAADILTETGVLKQTCLALAAAERPPLSEKHREIYKQIGYDTTPVELIQPSGGLTAGELSSILLVLELDGYIQSVPGGYIRTDG